MPDIANDEPLRSRLGEALDAAGFDSTDMDAAVDAVLPIFTSEVDRLRGDRDDALAELVDTLAGKVTRDPTDAQVEAGAMALAGHYWDGLPDVSKGDLMKHAKAVLTAARWAQP